MSQDGVYTEHRDILIRVIGGDLLGRDRKAYPELKRKGSGRMGGVSGLSGIVTLEGPTSEDCTTARLRSDLADSRGA